MLKLESDWSFAFLVLFMIITISIVVYLAYQESMRRKQSRGPTRSSSSSVSHHGSFVGGLVGGSTHALKKNAVEPIKKLFPQTLNEWTELLFFILSESWSFLLFLYATFVTLLQFLKVFLSRLLVQLTLKERGSTSSPLESLPPVRHPSTPKKINSLVSTGQDNRKSSLQPPHSKASASFSASNTSYVTDGEESSTTGSSWQRIKSPFPVSKELPSTPVSFDSLLSSSPRGSTSAVTIPLDSGVNGRVDSINSSHVIGNRKEEREKGSQRSVSKKANKVNENLSKLSNASPETEFKRNVVHDGLKNYKTKEEKDSLSSTHSNSSLSSEDDDLLLNINVTSSKRNQLSKQLEKSQKKEEASKSGDNKDLTGAISSSTAIDSLTAEQYEALVSSFIAESEWQEASKKKPHGKKTTSVLATVHSVVSESKEVTTGREKRQNSKELPNTGVPSTFAAKTQRSSVSSNSNSASSSSASISLSTSQIPKPIIHNPVSAAAAIALSSAQHQYDSHHHHTHHGKKSSSTGSIRSSGAVSLPHSDSVNIVEESMVDTRGKVAVTFNLGEVANGSSNRGEKLKEKTLESGMGTKLRRDTRDIKNESTVENQVPENGNGSPGSGSISVKSPVQTSFIATTSPTLSSQPFPPVSSLSSNVGSTALPLMPALISKPPAASTISHPVASGSSVAPVPAYFPNSSFSSSTSQVPAGKNPGSVEQPSSSSVAFVPPPYSSKSSAHKTSSSSSVPVLLNAPPGLFGTSSCGVNYGVDGHYTVLERGKKPEGETSSYRNQPFASSYYSASHQLPTLSSTSSYIPSTFSNEATDDDSSSNDFLRGMLDDILRPGSPSSSSFFSSNRMMSSHRDASSLISDLSPHAPAFQPGFNLNSINELLLSPSDFVSSSTGESQQFGKGKEQGNGGFAQLPSNLFNDEYWSFPESMVDDMMKSSDDN
jgi:hypothetical protein